MAKIILCDLQQISVTMKILESLYLQYSFWPKTSPLFGLFKQSKENNQMKTCTVFHQKQQEHPSVVARGCNSNNGLWIPFLTYGL